MRRATFDAYAFLLHGLRHNCTSIIVVVTLHRLKEPPHRSLFAFAGVAAVDAVGVGPSMRC